MPTDPIFYPDRRVWRVQYWGADGKWHRTIVGRAPARWKEGDPEPKKPPELHAKIAKLAEAEKEAREAWAKGVPDSLAGFLRRHLERYQKETTRAAARRAVDQFLEWCRGRRIDRRSQVDAATCDDFVDFLAGTYSIKTVETRVAYIAAAWGQMVRKRKLERTPWANIEIRGQERTKPKNAWTPEQFEILMDACKSEEGKPDRYAWLRDVLIFGTQTGLRIGTMMAITWDDWVHPQSDADGFGYLNIREEINKTAAYMVPVSRKLNDLLIRRFGKHKHPFILTGKAGRPLKNRQHTEMAIRSACKRTGVLPDPQSPNHHMRRSFGRWAMIGALTGQPVPIYIVSQWYGPATVEMTREYLGLEKYQSINFMVPDLAPPTTSTPTPPGATSPS